MIKRSFTTPSPHSEPSGKQQARRGLKRRQIALFWAEVTEFTGYLTKFVIRNLHLSFIKFELVKSLFATVLYRQRGKYARRFMHSGMAGLAALGMMIAPIIANEFPGESVDPWQIASASVVLSATSGDSQMTTMISEKARDKVVDYAVQQGDTVSSIGISLE
jgi:hypothetical protein